MKEKNKVEKKITAAVRGGEKIVDPVITAERFPLFVSFARTRRRLRV